GPVAAGAAAPLERAERVVDAQAHRGVDVLLGGHRVGDGVVREVDDPRHRAGDDHAGHVPDDADPLAERLEQAGGLGDRPGGRVRAGGEGDAARAAVVQGEVELDGV